MFMVDFFNADGEGATLLFNNQAQAKAIANYMTALYDEVWLYEQDEFGWLPCLY